MSVKLPVTVQSTGTIITAVNWRPLYSLQTTNLYYPEPHPDPDMGKLL